MYQAVVLLHYRGRGGKIKREYFINIRFDTQKEGKVRPAQLPGRTDRSRKWNLNWKHGKKNIYRRFAKYADNEKNHLQEG